MRRLLLAVLLVSAICPPADAADRIRIGYSSISGAYTPIWVAHDAGFFAKEGLQDDIILIPSGTQLAQVTVAGEIDIGSLNGSSAIAAALSGADLKIIGNSGNKMVFSLYVRPEIKNVDGMRGKKIGITRFGSAPDISVRFALRKFNINPDKDLTLIQLGFMATVAAGLQGGSIEGGVVSPPTQFAIDKAGFKELISITDMNYAFPNPALVAVGSIIRSKPDVINRFMRAYTRGVHKARTDREFTYKSMAKYTKINDQVVLQKAYDFYMSKVLENTPAVNMAGVVNVLDDLAKTVPAAKTAKPEQFVDMRFLDTLEKSGLLKELYP
jgi:NitT/TauT family transport system substrate-binding protein